MSISTNAVEQRNRDYKSDAPQFVEVSNDKVDNVTCWKHTAVEDGILLSYRSKGEEAKRMTAQHRMSVVPDKES